MGRLRTMVTRFGNDWRKDMRLCQYHHRSSLLMELVGWNDYSTLLSGFSCACLRNTCADRLTARFPRSAWSIVVRTNDSGRSSGAGTEVKVLPAFRVREFLPHCDSCLQYRLTDSDCIQASVPGSGRAPLEALEQMCSLWEI